MLKKTERHLFFFSFLILTLFSLHFIYNNANTNKTKNVNYIDYNLDRYFGTKSRYIIKSEISGAKFNSNSKFKLRQIQLVSFIFFIINFNIP